MSEFNNQTLAVHQVICEQPTIIINPLLPELVAKYGVVVHGDYISKLPTSKRYGLHYKFAWSDFNKRKFDVTHETLNEHYVLDKSTGETFPIYIEVPCNKCDVCRSRKVNGLVQRCRLETLSYDSRPWFCTLTYNDKYLPDYGVSKSDVQKFLKRFRINLQRSGFENKIRYIACGEYGAKLTRRPHYHLVIWNLPAYNTKDYAKVSDLLDRSWSMGRTQSRVVSGNDDKCLYYTCKYLFKQDSSNVPDGKRPTFFLASSGHGGIGSRFLDIHADEIRKTLNTKFKYLDVFSGQIKEMVFDQYILNRIFPSFSRSVPAKLRQSLADFSLSYAIAKRNNSLLLYDDIMTERYVRYSAKYGDALYVLPEQMIDYIPRDTLHGTIEELDALATFIESYNSLDVGRCRELSDMRNKFVYKLFRNAKFVDISKRAFLARHRINLANNRRVL